MYDVGLLGPFVNLVSVESSLQPVFCLPRFCLVLSFEFAIYLPPRRRILWPCHLKLGFGFRYVSSDKSLPQFGVVFGNMR